MAWVIVVQDVTMNRIIEPAAIDRERSVSSDFVADEMENVSIRSASVGGKFA